MTMHQAHATGQRTACSHAASDYLFTAQQVAIGTFLAGPICGGYLLARNFRRLQSNTDAVLVVGIGLIWMALTLGLGFLLPEIPNPVFWAVNGLLARLATREMMGEALQQHEATGGAFATGGQFFLAILPVLAAELAVFFAFALILL